MTAKEKAKELAEKMLGDNNHYLNQNIEIDKLIAKQCALICVDEILNSHIDSVYESYYLEVKQEINKLISYDNTTTIEGMGL
jgi:hypothetical protein